MEKRRYISMKS